MHLLNTEEKQALIRKGGSLETPFPASSTMPRAAASAPYPRPALLFKVS